MFALEPTIIHWFDLHPISRIEMLGRSIETIQWDMLSVCIVSRSGLVYGPTSLCRDSWWISIGSHSRRAKVHHPMHYSILSILRDKFYEFDRAKLIGWYFFVLFCALSLSLSIAGCIYATRFITTNIRNELDYSPQTIYWLGGKFESNKHLKWNDGSNITYKVWWWQTAARQC